MPWDRNYYYRSVRVNGKPRRVYVGAGAVGVEAAEQDRRAKEERQLRRLEADQLRAGYAELDTDLDAVYRLADTLSRVALYAAGFHQHCQGDWKPKRDRRT